MSDSLNAPTPIFVGDNLALDFINTTYGAGTNKCEIFLDDESVLRWLIEAGVNDVDSATVSHNGLLAAALELRKIAVAMVHSKQSNNWYNPATLNRFLSAGSTHALLCWEPTSVPAVKSIRTVNQLLAYLAPVAEALAFLLADPTFDRVKKCECDDCTLLFHDRTKAGRRRWCSMAICGNRMKVAAFRARVKSN